MALGGKRACIDSLQVLWTKVWRWHSSCISCLVTGSQIPSTVHYIGIRSVVARKSS